MTTWDKATCYCCNRKVADIIAGALQRQGMGHYENIRCSDCRALCVAQLPCNVRPMQVKTVGPT